MASRQEAANDSLETSVEKVVKDEQRKTVDRIGQEPIRRRKSPFATVARTHSPRPSPVKPRPSDFEQVAPSRPRFSEDTPKRPVPAEEESPMQEQADTAEDNYCLSVALTALTLVVLGAVFLYSWASASAVK